MQKIPTLIKRVIAAMPALIVLVTLHDSAMADTIRFVKAQSGPSGRIADNRFVFDEVRNRFVYPQDKSLTVSFEWEAPPGNHTLSAFWKDPEGRVASISPDVKMEIKTSLLQAYWVYELVPAMRSGIWMVEIRIDGEPAGSHSFELISSEPSKTEAPPPSTKAPTLDEIYASVGKSLVWIYKLDAAGGRADTSMGFVIAKGSVATAFQAIDECAGVYATLLVCLSTTLQGISGDGRRHDVGASVHFLCVGCWTRLDSTRIGRWRLCTHHGNGIARHGAAATGDKHHSASY